MVPSQERKTAMNVRKPTMDYPFSASAQLPVGLSHVDSDSCWCDPIVEVDDTDGEEIILHRQVTWN
jgi:hypothetical protein